MCGCLKMERLGFRRLPGVPCLLDKRTMRSGKWCAPGFVELVAAGVGAGTIKNTVNTLKAVLSSAVEGGALKVNRAPA